MYCSENLGEERILPAGHDDLPDPVIKNSKFRIHNYLLTARFAQDAKYAKKTLYRIVTANSINHSTLRVTPFTIYNDDTFCTHRR